MPLIFVQLFCLVSQFFTQSQGDGNVEFIIRKIKVGSNAFGMDILDPKQELPSFLNDVGQVVV